MVLEPIIDSELLYFSSPSVARLVRMCPYLRMRWHNAFPISIRLSLSCPVHYLRGTSSFYSDIAYFTA